jgi:hypothetical protein
MWVDNKHRAVIVAYIVERMGRAVTNSEQPVCFVKKPVQISTKDACKMLQECKVATLTVMQFGQKADFDNRAVQWALKNV